MESAHHVGAGVDEIHEEMRRQLASIGTFLFGRACFELWEKVWPPLAQDPASSSFEREFSGLVERIQKVVYSKTLQSVSWHNSRLAKESLAEEWPE